ncbi:MAG: DUF1343 domain-containing protein [Ignavibacteriales bacterium]|nr:DUF1343 domain-containing protein [Ignavibacteriales bacterium]
MQDRSRKTIVRWYLIAATMAVFPSFVFPGDRVKTGIEVLRDRGFDVLKGKRVGLITNPTGVTSSLEATVDVLARAPGVTLVALFGPEHGVRGDREAGKYVESSIDEATRLPVYSLYGKTRKPTPEMLKGVDVLVYDIQDIGVRSYTYISTMGFAMEAAAENGIEFVVLDRPNPLTGVRVEGTMLDENFKSFVGMYPIPYVYGMTAGELATMINEERWLNGGKRCKLQVVPMAGWKRSLWWDETGLPWVPPSPHIPNSTTPMFYVMTGLLGELGTVNQGVGYTLPFELVGAPWLDGRIFARYLNSQGMPGVQFRPMVYRPFYFDTTGQPYGGVHIHVTDRDRVELSVVQFAILEALFRLFPERDIFQRARTDKVQMFDKVNGSDRVRMLLQTKGNVDDILRVIDRERAQFMIKREKYLIYY